METIVKLAIYGGSFNPPTLNHQQIVTSVASYFPRTVVVPCSTHPFKQGTGAVARDHRIAMARLAFTGLEPGVEIDFTDFDRSEGRRAFERQAQYEEQGEVWHVVGYDLVAGGRNGTSEIQKKWMHGVSIWAQFNWVVMQRPCAPFMKEDLPPNHLLLPAVPVERSSTQVRERVAQGLSIADFVSPLVAAYIERNSLYCRSVN